MKNALLGALLVGLVFVAGYAFYHAAPGEQPAGATPGNRIDGPESCVNGVCTYSYARGMSPATTTPCSIQSPQASTTMLSQSVLTTTGTTSAMLLEVGNATTQYATTTRIAYLAMGASTLATEVATSGALTDTIIPPGTWIVPKFGKAPNGDVSQLSIQGTCSVVLRSLKQ